jgi:hypothetical protein
MANIPNPAALMKLLAAKKQFEQAHPKAIAFCRALAAQGVEAGTVIEVTVTKPDGSTLATNLRVQQSDLDLLQTLKSMNAEQ